MPDAGPSVFIVDDHSFFRAGLRSLLMEHGFPVVGEAPTGEAAMPLIERRHPDIVVMDLSMPGMSGAEATRELRRRFPAIAVLVVTVSAGELDVLDALEAGAAGYLLKDAGPEEIMRALQAAVDGDTPLSPRVAGMIVERARGVAGGVDASSRVVEELTARELEVFKLIARGMSNAEIAAELIVSETTVKTHVARILMKLHLRDRVQAVVYAYESGLSQPGAT
jgi:DNA-binding NarL/FixJ family response regulator